MQVSWVGEIWKYVTESVEEIGRSLWDLVSSFFDAIARLFKAPPSEKTTRVPQSTKKKKWHPPSAMTMQRRIVESLENPNFRSLPVRRRPRSRLKLSLHSQSTHHSLLALLIEKKIFIHLEQSNWFLKLRKIRKISLYCGSLTVDWNLVKDYFLLEYIIYLITSGSDKEHKQRAYEALSDTQRIEIDLQHIDEENLWIEKGIQETIENELEKLQRRIDAALGPTPGAARA